MPLTNISCTSAKSGPKVRTLSDGGGLQLRILPTGGKSWRLGYRFDGKQQSLPIGRFPEITLAQARMVRDEAKALLARGIDPHAHREALSREAEAARAETFAIIAEELLLKLTAEGKAPVTIDKRRWLISKALPALGCRPIAEITAPEILKVLRVEEVAGRYETATRLRESIGQVFRLAIASGRATSDPTRDMRGALVSPTVTNRAAILDPKRLGDLLRATDDYEVSQARSEVVTAMRLLIATATRPGEVRGATWSEFDLDASVWTLPASRTKQRRTHRVILAPRTAEMVRALRDRTAKCDPGDLLFPANGRPGRPMSENTFVMALRSMGFGADEVSAHGFRATFSTMANEAGKWSPDAIELALGHAIGGGDVRRAYGRHALEDERRALAVWWADRLETLRRGAAVVPMTAKRGRRE